MNNTATYNNILTSIMLWENSLQNYTEDFFRQKPDDDGWTIGQLYAHLVNGTLKFHIGQIEACNSSNENENETKSLPGKLIFFINSFPPLKIKVPPSETYTPKQPENKEEIIQGIKTLRTRLQKTVDEIDSSKYKGKTKHPAFGYMSANEWFRLIEMHFRHHLKQKVRLEKFLNV